MNFIFFDGQDVALIRCAVIDVAGRVVPGASNSVTFAVSGPGAVYGVGNGDPANLVPDKVGQKDLPYGGVWTIPTFMGLVRAIVQTESSQPGKVVITATSPGLKAGVVSFDTTAPPPTPPAPAPITVTNVQTPIGLMGGGLHTLD